MIIILSGAIGRCCGVGGKAWVYMQYLLGLRALGYEVIYLEDCGQESWVYRWEDDDVTTDLSYPAAYVRSCLEPFGLGDKWIYRAGNQSEGMPLDDFLEICARASLFIVRANPIPVWRTEYDWPQRRIFIDVDPGFNQMRLTEGPSDLAETVNRCERLFSISQRIGKADCHIPTAGRTWLKTLPPVFLQHWPRAQTDSPNHFTSIMDWRGFRDIVYKGSVYGQKNREFPKFLELPQFTSQSFLVALLGASPDKLSEFGWQVVPGGVPTRTPWLYRQFIQGSRAEFSVAKHGYVATQGGWFSDRSICYLASGKPVLAQDTGITDCLPVGEGILSFRDMSEALRGVAGINSDYDRHCRAARQLAEAYFATEEVLPSLLEDAMN